MNDLDKTKDQLVEELDRMRRRAAELEARVEKSERRADALKEMLSKYRQLTEKSVVGVYLVQDNRFKYVNPRFAEIFGYEAEELVEHKTARDIVFEDDWPIVDENLKKRVSGQVDAVNFQYRGIRKDRTVIHIEAYGSRTEYEDKPAIIGTLLDISGRVVAERNLERELAKFRALYELALGMIAERSLDENLSLIVERSKELLGADKAFIAMRDESAGDLYMHTLSGIVTEEFKGLRIPSGAGMGGKVAETGQWHIVEDYFAEVGPDFHEVARAEGLFSGIAVPMRTGAANLGVLYAFNRTKRPFSKADLDTLLLFGNLAAVEITRKRVQERLRESRRLYRELYEESKKREELYVSLLNSSADAIVIYDMEGRAQYVNPSFTRIFGWTMEEVRDKRIPFLPESERETTMAIIHKLIGDGTPTSAFESRRFRKDGRILDVSISASRYHDLNGSPAGTMAILRDITDRKRVEEALRISEEQYRDLYGEAERRGRLYLTLLEASPEPIVVYDVEGIPTYCNPAFTRVFGWRFEEIAGKRIDFVPPDNWPETNEMIATVLRGENFAGRETRRFTKDGRIIDVSVSGAIFHDENDRPTGSVVHLRDITARKRAESNLEAELKKFQVLYDLALAMIAERTLDENLALVVDKSREILGADKSFIALRDEEAGELRMHTLSGIVTEEMKRLRIPMGVGLGGMVAQTGQWHIVEDYFQEVGPDFHEVVRAEGMVSGIAVPVRIGDHNLGVLYVFDTEKTPYSKADLDTLSLLGNLAALEITRRQAQERLQESQESYRTLYEEARRREELYVSLLNSSADAIVIYDMEGMAHYVNPSFTRIFGWSLDEVEGVRIPFLPESEREASMKIIRGLIDDGTPCSGFESRRLTRDGNLLDVSISASRYRDHEGDPAGLLVILRDISDRKRAQKALMESEERFRTLAEAAPFGIGVSDGEEKTLYVNPKFKEIFGYSIEDVPDLQTWFSKAYPNEDRRRRAEASWKGEQAYTKVDDQLAAEASPSVFKVRCKDGTDKIISFHGVLLADGRNIVTFQDVTAEVEAQQQILQAKNEWERTFNSVSDLILILDGAGRVIRANKAVSDRLGPSMEQLLGTHCSDEVDGISLSSLCFAGSAQLREGWEFSWEVSDESLGGEFDVRVTQLIDELGRLIGSVHVARDITAFKSMERARRVAVHHLSHELKTPLSVIKGSVKDLDTGDLSQEIRKSKVERIRRNLERLSDLQLTVKEIVAPRDYQPVPIRMAPFIDEVLDALRERSAFRSVRLTSEIDMVETDILDPGVFRDFLETLVKNAIENTPDEGEVAVSVKPDPEGVLLEVRDTGVGIPESQKEYLFEAFHHTQATDRYATRNPYDFDAGGKGLELMRLKILAQDRGFDLSYQTTRCPHLEEDTYRCPGRVSECPHVNDPESCAGSGGSTFSILFRQTGK